MVGAEYIVLAATAGIVTDLILKKKLSLRRSPKTIILSLVAIVILCIAFDNPLVIIKGFLFAHILIFAGVYDAKTKAIPDVVHLMIAAVSVIGINPSNAVVGLFAGLLPFLVIGVVYGGIGGGDIKLMGTAGLVLGGMGIIQAGIIGLSTTLIFALLTGIGKNKSIPLAPFLGLGCFMSYCMTYM